MTAGQHDIPADLSEFFEKISPEDEIVLDRNGSWRVKGAPVRDTGIIDYLNRSLTAGVDGAWRIRHGDRFRNVTVEDTAIFVTGVRYSGVFQHEKITLELSDGKTELLDIYTLSYKNNGLYCRINNGSMPVKFMRSPSYQILERIDEVGGRFYLSLCGQKILMERE